MFVKNFSDITFINAKNSRLWQHVEIQARDSEQLVPMNADAAAEAETVNHGVETIMNLKVTMKTMMTRKMKMMIIEEIVTWVPVVTRKTGMMIMMITIRVAEAVEEEWICVQGVAIMIMTILTMQKEAAAIGKDKEEIKAGGMDMKEMMTIALIQEEALVAITLIATVAEQEKKVQTGEPAAMKAATAIQDQVAHLIMVMETEGVALQTEWEMIVQIGAPVAIRDAAAEVIPTNRVI